MYKELIIPNKNATVLVGLSLLVMACVMASVHASECEVMQFLKDKSQAIQIQKNSCINDDKVSLGADFIVAPGGRLWLKVDATENTDFQLICQNRGATTVTVKYFSPFLPWVKPESVGHCGAWVDNKLSCSDKNGAKNSFVCAIAVIKRPEYLQLTTLERTTSVKMRNMGQEPYVENGLSVAKPETIKSITAVIRSEIKLCRNLFQVPKIINASWILDVSGQVEKLSFSNADAMGKSFMSCIETVVNSFDYPRFDEKVIFSSKF